MKSIKHNEHGFGLVETLLAILIVLVLLLGGYYVDRTQSQKNASSSSGGSSTSSSNSGGEQLSQKGKTRPPQYLQICATNSGVEYITQGSPQCLGSDAYEGSYSPGVPGTLFSSPCKTTSGTLRYVYISENETCPDNTKLVFYNTLCPNDASSSDDCTTPDSSDTTN
jgi:hypothetical protein